MQETNAEYGTIGMEYFIRYINGRSEKCYKKKEGKFQAWTI
jgi:hypothetical protein